RRLAGEVVVQPVRVKAYGLVYLTRPTYLIIQSIGLVLLLSFLAVCLLLPRPVPAEQHNAGITWILDYGPLVVVAVLFLEAIETTIILMRFAQKEAEQRHCAPPDDLPLPG